MCWSSFWIGALSGLITFAIILFAALMLARPTEEELRHEGK
jgi:hypothetical protein